MYIPLIIASNDRVICCFPAKHYGVRANTGWLAVRILCPSGATYLLLFQWATVKIQNKSVGLVQSQHHHPHLKSNLFSP